MKKADREIVAQFKLNLIIKREWLYRAIKAIYARQTNGEQLSMSTTEHNKVGFSGVDAYIMSKFAEDLNKCGFLTPKQEALAKRKMPKYAGQLLQIARENGKI